ncbi:MAG: tetratricopeptide repeat protein [Planctomycetales bacterium]|nr:tetratricopeptide repeat protein [Planctomycetales bacterium]
MPFEPRAFLADFGLAKSVATGSSLTRTGVALGTPAYMSPEQARGETGSHSPATDVWSLGCVLYEALAGRRPFEGESHAAVVAAVLMQDPPRLGSARPDVPRGLEELVGACLAKRPGDRPRDGAALGDDLDRVLRGEPPAARRPRRAGTAALAALAAAAALAGLLAVALPDRADREVAATQVLAGPGAPGPTAAESQAARARALRQTDPVAAARHLGDALAAEPGRDEWRLERGLLLWCAGDAAGARGEWDRIPPGSPSRAEARLYRGFEGMFEIEGGGLGRKGILRSDFEEAERAGGRLARLARAAMALVERDWSRVAPALEGEPGWEASLLRACAEGERPGGDPMAEIREYDAALAEGPAFAWGFCNRGACRADMGDHAAALRDHEAALRIRPDLAQSLLNRGHAREKLGDLRGAFEDYTAALRSRPDYAKAYHHRACVREERGDAAGALADYGEALRLRPAYVEVLVNRGGLRRACGDSQGALEDLDGALRINPKLPEALSNRGNAKQSLGDLPGALADYEAALRLRPDSPVLLGNRGSALALLGQTGAALEDLDRAIALKPDYRDAWRNRAILRQQGGDHQGAVADFTEALRLGPGDPEARAARATSRMALGDTEAAVEDLREFLRAAPGHPHAAIARENLARCEERLSARPGGR